MYGRFESVLRQSSLVRAEDTLGDNTVHVHLTHDAIPKCEYTVIHHQILL